jgi:transcriptional/translational regulatory protein YebC/TACO1
MKAIEAGADDFKKDEESVTIYTDPDKLATLITALKSETPIIETNIAYVAINSIDMESQDDYNAFLSFVEDFEDSDDVAEVFHNVLS